MTRRKNITQEEFDNCIAKLQQKGHKPSVTRVLDEIGGSYGTIGKMFKAWEQSEANSTQSTSEIPEEALKKANDLFSDWWHKIQSEADASIRQVQEATTRQVTEANNERDEFLDVITSLESDLDLQRADHENRFADLNKMHELEIKALKSELSKAEEKADYLEKSLKDSHKQGFYPDFADTSKKPDNGQKECLCRREENTVPSSSRVPLNKPASQALAVLRLLMSWALPRTC